MERPELKTYLKLCTEFYDLEKHPHDEEALVFYMQMAQRANGPILEPMCGTGRFLIPMLQAGLDAEGFDASEYMLDAFRQKYVQISAQKAPAWQQFLQDFSNDKRYQLIFIPYGSLGLITNYDDLKKSLAVLYNHLAIDGKFIFEVETIASVPLSCGVWQRGVNTRADGSKIALSFITSYEPQIQIFQSFSRYELIVNGVIEKTEEENFQQYLFRFDELDKLFMDAGFTNVKKYQPYDSGKTVDNDAPTIIYECIK